jgi:AI-2E family transporter
MNAAVGVATAIVMWSTGLGDPILWGTVAFLLNYVPILGPTVGVILFLLAGLLTMDTLWKAFLPALLYLGIHLAEGEMITPTLVAKRFTVNPVLVVLSLIFWFWMWGAAGAIIAVPMLAIAKIICDRVQSLSAFGHFLEGEVLSKTRACAIQEKRSRGAGGYQRWRCGGTARALTLATKNSAHRRLAVGGPRRFFHLPSSNSPFDPGVVVWSSWWCGRHRAASLTKKRARH